MTAAGLSREVCLVAAGLDRIAVDCQYSPSGRALPINGSASLALLLLPVAARRFQWPLPLRRAIALTRVRFNEAPLGLFLTTYV